MSDELIIDLSNYKDRLGSRVAPGVYRVVVEDAEAAESAAKNPMVNLWFRVVGSDYDGQTITDRLVLTDKSLFRVVGFMQAIGMPTPKQKLKLNIRQFIGKSLDVEVDDGEPYNGRVRSEVRGYNKIPGGNRQAEVDMEDIFSANLAAAAPDSATDVFATDLPSTEDAVWPTTADEVAAPVSVIDNEPSAVELALAAVPAASVAVADDGAVDLDAINL